MTVIAVTSCEGTPEAIENLIKGSKASAPIHEKMGAKNPRLWRAIAGDGMESAFYSIEFESHSAYGAFTDEMLGSDWWKEQIVEAAGAAYPDLKIMGLQFTMMPLKLIKGEDNERI